MNADEKAWLEEARRMCAYDNNSAAYERYCRFARDEFRAAITLLQESAEREGRLLELLKRAEKIARVSRVCGGFDCTCGLNVLYADIAKELEGHA